MEPARRQGQADLLVEIAGVSKTYASQRGRVHAVAGVSLAIEKGEFVSLLGPSGCGKSTLLMMVAGLVPCTGGRITIDGAPVTRPYTNLGIVFQQDLLMSWRSILNNVLVQVEIRRMLSDRYRARAMELLAQVGLAGFEDKYPHELSGGMRQRAAICRALVHDPPLLLMDEPFGALDALTREQMNLDLMKMWSLQRQTVLFVTHSISEAVFLSDRVLVMSSRPGRFIDEVAVHLPRPRLPHIRETAEFNQYVAHIKGVLYRTGAL